MTSSGNGITSHGRGSSQLSTVLADRRAGWLGLVREQLAGCDERGYPGGDTVLIEGDTIDDDDAEGMELLAELERKRADALIPAGCEGKLDGDVRRSLE